MNDQTTMTREKLKKGDARCPGAPSTQDIIAADKVAAPSWVRSESYKFLGDEDIPKDRYIDPAYAKREFETLWKKTWQFARSEEHTSELQSLMRSSYAVFCLKKKNKIIHINHQKIPQYIHRHTQQE